MKKRLISIVLSALLVLSASACAATPEASGTTEKPAESAAESGAESAGAATDKKGKIAVVTYVSSAPYFSVGKEQTIATGEKLGYEVIWTGTPEVDTPGLIDIVSNLIEQNVDAICLASGDTSSVVPICQKAREKGIKVVSFDLDIDKEGRDAYAGLMDLTELGVPMIESVVKSIGDSGEYAIVTGVLTNEFLKARIELCEAYAKEKYPNLKLVTVEGGDSDPQKAYAVTKNILTAYPDVKAIVSNVSDSLGAVASAIEDSGKLGEVYACGMSTPNLAKPAMESGACTNAFLWDPAKWQSWAVTLAAALVEGKDLPEGKLDLDGFPQAEKVSEDTYYYYETFEFTPENIKDFDF